MPKVDCLVDGSLRRDDVLREIGLDPARPTVLYAPTWSPASSLNLMGVELIERLLAQADQPDRQAARSLARPAAAVFRRHRLARPAGAAAGASGRAAAPASANITPYLAAADVMITDHSSAGFEYLLLDRPIVRIHLPELLDQANVHPDYARLLADCADNVTTADRGRRRGRGAWPTAPRLAATRRACGRRPVPSPGHGDRPLRRRALRRAGAGAACLGRRAAAGTAAQPCLQSA